MPGVHASCRELGSRVLVAWALLVGATACPASVPTTETSAPTASEAPSPRPESPPRPKPQRRAPLQLSVHEELTRPELPGPIRLEAFEAETVAPDPTDPSDPGGAGINLVLRRCGVLVEGYIDADPSVPLFTLWTDACRVEVRGYDPSTRSIGVVLERVTDDRVNRPPVEVFLSTGKTAAVGGGLSIRFVGHSHKRTFAGQRSALVVEVRYEHDGIESMGFVSLYPPDDTTWRWRSYAFRLVEWDYDRHVVLEVRRFRRVVVD